MFKCHNCNVILSSKQNLINHKKSNKCKTVLNYTKRLEENVNKLKELIVKPEPEPEPEPELEVFVEPEPGPIVEEVKKPVIVEEVKKPTRTEEVKKSEPEPEPENQQTSEQIPPHNIVLYEKIKKLNNVFCILNNKEIMNIINNINSFI